MVFEEAGGLVADDLGVDLDDVDTLGQAGTEVPHGGLSRQRASLISPGDRYASGVHSHKAGGVLDACGDPVGVLWAELGTDVAHLATLVRWGYVG